MSSLTFGLFGKPANRSTSPLLPPTTDTAANDSTQQQQTMAKQKGVLANIFAGNNNSTPITSKQQLGS